MKVKKDVLAKMIDHTAIDPYTTTKDIKKICEEAKIYGFGAVAINSCYVPFAVDILRGTEVKVCSTVDLFYINGHIIGDGYSSTEVRAFEAKTAIESGAEEIDMVMNLGKFKSGDNEFVKEDIKSVVEAVKEEGSDKIVKVIVPTNYLSKNEIIKASKIIKATKADFVKIYRHLPPKGVSVEDVKLVREAVGKKMGVKATGGIRNFDYALKLIEAGATRIGTSHSVEVILGWHPTGKC